jgi:hypothetical protein
MDMEQRTGATLREVSGRTLERILAQNLLHSRHGIAVALALVLLLDPLDLAGNLLLVVDLGQMAEGR